MTRFKRGSRRFSAGLCALLMVASLVAFPLRARAMSVALEAAGLALTVTAFLNLAGIYPFDTESSFGDWSEGGLADLIQQYNDTAPVIPINEETIHSYLYYGTAILTHNAYQALRMFVSWIKDTFSLADNQEAVEIGSLELNSEYLPYSSVAGTNISILLQYGKKIGETVSGDDFLAYTRRDDSCILPMQYIDESGDLCVILVSPFKNAVVVWGFSSGASISNGQLSDFAWSNPNPAEFSTLYFQGLFNVRGLLHSVIPDIPALTQFDVYNIYQTYYGYSSSDAFFGVVADIATVSVPPELPVETEYIGLSVTPGTVEGVGEITPYAVERIIQQGVTDRERPVVTPVEVEVATGTDIDTDTGVITQNPVVVEVPDSVAIQGAVEIAPPTINSDPHSWEIPDLNTVFPFSIPWDIFNIYSALNAEPVRPSFSASILIPVLNVQVPFEIAVPDSLSEQVDAFAALFRKLLLVVLCVGTLFFIYERMNL